MAKLNDRDETPNVFFIPDNFVDSGKVLGGLIKTRNLVEAIIIVLGIGYPIIFWTPWSVTAKIIVAFIGAVPLGIAALVGVNDGPLSEWIVDVFRFLTIPKDIPIPEKAKETKKGGKSHGK